MQTPICWGAPLPRPPAGGAPPPPDPADKTTNRNYVKPKVSMFSDCWVTLNKKVRSITLNKKVRSLLIAGGLRPPDPPLATSRNYIKQKRPISSDCWGAPPPRPPLGGIRPPRPPPIKRPVEMTLNKKFRSLLIAGGLRPPDPPLGGLRSPRPPRESDQSPDQQPAFLFRLYGIGGIG